MFICMWWREKLKYQDIILVLYYTPLILELLCISYILFFACIIFKSLSEKIHGLDPYFFGLGISYFTRQIKNYGRDGQVYMVLS